MVETNDSSDSRSINCTILAVLWDDISGPTVISLHPLVFDDPESIALQIYLASVTVFGQHGQSQRTEFSVPLLSIGKDVIARVAFDSWYDPSLRGEERPFFLAFIMRQKTSSLLNTLLDTQIFSYLDQLKEIKSSFDSKNIWNQIQKAMSQYSDKKTRLDEFQVDSDYAIPRALQDLRTASEAWEKLEDRKQLWIAIKVANRLENINDLAAGKAFILTGNIFQANSNYEDSQNAFERAAAAFSRSQEFGLAGEAYCLAGRNAYLSGKHERAIELLQSGAIWIKEPIPLASLQYDLGLVYHDLSRTEEANSCFEKAVKLVEGNDQLAAKYSSTYGSKLLIQSEQEKSENPTYALGLSRKSAEQRIKASMHLKRSDEGLEEAATSLVLAAKIFFSLGNENKGITLLKEASSLFIRVENHQSALKTLYDGTRNIQDSEKSISLLNNALNLIPEKMHDQKIKKLLGLISFELGQFEDQKNNLLLSFNHTNQALIFFKESRTKAAEVIPVLIQLGTISFKTENFEEAATYFYRAFESLSELETTQINTDKKDRSLKNALISWRRASTVYHNAGIIALKNNQERESIKYFTQSVSLLIEWVENNLEEAQEEVQKLIEERISKLLQKLSLFLLAESRYKLDAIISDLKSLVNSEKTINQ
jgi:tetratricopeptide (TPR) repeat protein